MNTDRSSLLNRVPEVTMYFWIIKVMATTVGESAADYINFNLGLGLQTTSAIMAVGLAVALGVQLWRKRYVPTLYWLVVVMLSIVGTLVTDTLVDVYEVPLTVTTGVFAVLLAATFGIWYQRERTLSIHSIHTVSRELFYWTAIGVTFALGTAAGDLVGEEFGLGYGLSAAVFASAMALVTVGWQLKWVSPVTAFWAVYVLTGGVFLPRHY